MNCTRPNCVNELSRRSNTLCELHYRKILHYTRHERWFDPGPCAERIQHYRDHRWLYQDIADACGLPKMTITDTHNLTRKRISRKTYDALMGLPLLEGSPVTRVGFRRRLQALAWMGWSQLSVASEMGCTFKHLGDVAARERGFSSDLGASLVRVYDKLSTTQGPNSQAAQRARRLGYAPPAAWDDDTIDTAPELSNGTFIDQPVVKYRPRRLTKCKRDHDMAEENTGIRPTGERFCRQCRREREQERYQRQKNVTV